MNAPIRWWAALCLAFLIAGPYAAFAEDQQDHRAWQHGIQLLQVNQRVLLLWASAGNAGVNGQRPEPNLGGDWPHDIYAAWLSLPWEPNQALNAWPLVVGPEAQEPPSAAINTQGQILLTSEDGRDGIHQYAGLWDSDLAPQQPYQRIKRGGHSGHVSALGAGFMLSYGEGWVNGGAWHNLGTGEKIYARLIDAQGNPQREVQLTAKAIARPRDSWPLIASSPVNALVVWQRYPEMTLQSALINAQGKVLQRKTLFAQLPTRYSYTVEYVPQLAAYVVAATVDGAGVISVIGLDGKTLLTQNNLPPLMSESRLVFAWDGEVLQAAYPVMPQGAALLAISREKITLLNQIGHAYQWDYTGTTGLFIAPKEIVFFSLSTAGLQQILIQVP